MPDTAAVATRPDSALAQPMDALDAERIRVLRDTLASDLNDAEWSLYQQVIRHTGLDPFQKQIYAIVRKSFKDGREIRRVTFQTGIDGYRRIAQRTGRYDGQTDVAYGPPCDCVKNGYTGDARLAYPHPEWARVGVYLRGVTHATPATAYFHEYVVTGAQGAMWRRMPRNQIAKCFDDETDVLTDAGFRRFADVGQARIIQVTEHGLETTDARPFAQPYVGPMIGAHGDMLDFCVTPNHDMATTVGRVEASAILATATSQAAWRVPLIAPHALNDAPISDDDLRLTGYVLADGSLNGERWVVSVSRPYKVEALAQLAPTARHVRHSKGSVAVAAARTVVTNFDKQVFSFPRIRTATIIDDRKRLDAASVLMLSARQARILLDAWQQFDGHTDHRSGARRIYTSRLDHVHAIELLACVAAYTVNAPRSRTNDLSDSPGYTLTLSDTSDVPVVSFAATRPQGVRDDGVNMTGTVWCVTVPSGRIIVRRRGFSMVCGNCAEALALRKAFPNDYNGVYTDDEMAQADAPATERPDVPAAPRVSEARVVEAATPVVVDGVAQPQVEAVVDDMTVEATETPQEAAEAATPAPIPTPAPAAPVATPPADPPPAVATQGCPEPDCDGRLVKRHSARGDFMGCSNYPTCRHIGPMKAAEAAATPAAPTGASDADTPESASLRSAIQDIIKHTDASRELITDTLREFNCTLREQGGKQFAAGLRALDMPRLSVLKNMLDDMPKPISEEEARSLFPNVEPEPVRAARVAQEGDVDPDDIPF